MEKVSARFPPTTPALAVEFDEDIAKRVFTSCSQIAFQLQITIIRTTSAVFFLHSSSGFTACTLTIYFFLFTKKSSKRNSSTLKVFFSVVPNGIVAFGCSTRNCLLNFYGEKVMDTLQLNRQRYFILVNAQQRDTDYSSADDSVIAELPFKTNNKKDMRITQEDFRQTFCLFRWK